MLGGQQLRPFRQSHHQPPDLPVDLHGDQGQRLRVSRGGQQCGQHCGRGAGASRHAGVDLLDLEELGLVLAQDFLQQPLAWFKSSLSKSLRIAEGGEGIKGLALFAGQE